MWQPKLTYMLSRSEKWFILIQSLLFALLFHRQPLGLNLLIYELIVIVWLHRLGRITFTRNVATVYIGLLISGLAVVFSYSSFAIFINITTFVLFFGVILFPEVRSLPNALIIALNNLLKSPAVFFSPSAETGKKAGFFYRLWRFRIFLIPMVIIIIFISIYASSNPIFNDITTYIQEHISKSFEFIFNKVDGWILFTWLLGLFVAAFTAAKFLYTKMAEKDRQAPDFLLRIRGKILGKSKLSVSLKNEWKAAVFLLFTLNLTILLLNVIDIYSVWINFQWHGSLLKQFVHEGTYLLILSILISIVIVLYFFRGNLNHFKQSKLLRVLSYIWLVQNAVLVVSVAIRNFWYIHYFSLAYKRIGVIIFLLLTLYGIYTVIQKVYNKKTRFYLVKSNSLALFVVMVLCTIPNWDVMIAKYNFRNYDHAFVHLDFLAGLSDKALPYLDKSLEELSKIHIYQEDKFQFKRMGKDWYITPELYHEIIQRRKVAFIDKWENKSLLSWNLPEYLAYEKLKMEGK